MIIGRTEDGWLIFADGSSCSEPRFEIVRDRDGTITTIDVERTIDGGEDSEAAIHAELDSAILKDSIDTILGRRILN